MGFVPFHRTPATGGDTNGKIRNELTGCAFSKAHRGGFWIGRITDMLA
jgi:hypothetical protein